MRRPPRPHRPLGPGLGPRSLALPGTRGLPPIMARVPPPGLGISSLRGMMPVSSGVGAVSSCTNSTDPASMDSRLFVGNLNTLALSKEAIESIFSPYGIIMGISMHKGYAFVQFGHPDEARRAGASEDGKIYAGQAIDINIVSQPKNRTTLKRSSGARPVALSDAKKPKPEKPGTNQSLQRTLVTLSGSGEPATTRIASSSTVKKALATVAKKSGRSAASSIVKTNTDVRKNVTNLVSNLSTAADILICGTCKLQVSSLASLSEHKKIPCSLRLSSVVEGNASVGDDREGREPDRLECATCEAEFSGAWALCQHCVLQHHMSIYKPKINLDVSNPLDNGGRS